MRLNLEEPLVRSTVLPMVDMLQALLALPWPLQVLFSAQIISLTNTLNGLMLVDHAIMQSQGGYQLPAKRPPTVCG